MDAGYRLCQSGEFSELISPYIIGFAIRREKSEAAQRLEIFEKFFHINQLIKVLQLKKFINVFTNIGE